MILLCLTCLQSFRVPVVIWIYFLTLRGSKNGFLINVSLLPVVEGQSPWPTDSKTFFLRGGVEELSNISDPRQLPWVTVLTMEPT